MPFWTSRPVLRALIAAADSPANARASPYRLAVLGHPNYTPCTRADVFSVVVPLVSVNKCVVGAQIGSVCEARSGGGADFEKAQPEFSKQLQKN